MCIVLTHTHTSVFQVGLKSVLVHGARSLVSSVCDVSSLLCTLSGFVSHYVYHVFKIQLS